MRKWVVCLLLGCCLPMWAESDLNGDGRVSVGDVTRLVDWLLRGDAANGHEYVDFGLPSGTLWATMNIGATAPEEPGELFAWGETEGKDFYNQENYAWTTDGDSLTGYAEENDTLLFRDDAASRWWGGLWHLPSIDQLLELKQYCRWSWAVVDGMYCYRVSRGTKYIYLPAAGYMRDGTRYEENLSGNYWARETYAANANMAYTLYFDDEDILWAYRTRYSGRSVRAVFSPEDEVERFDVNGDGRVNMTDVEELVNEVKKR